MKLLTTQLVAVLCWPMNKGQHYSKTLSSQENCIIRSNKPVLVAQFSHSGYEERDYFGDPMMMIVPDTLQFSNEFHITTIRNPTRSDYQHYVNLVLLAQYYRPDMIHLISGGRNVLLNVAREWLPIRANNIIEAYANISTSGKLAGTLYKLKHDHVLKYLHWLLYMCQKS